VLERTERVLTGAERHALAERVARAREEKRLALAKTAISSAFVCGFLGLLTYAASTAPLAVIVLFWSVLAGVFTLWLGLPWHRTMRDQVTWLEDAIAANRARVIRVVAGRVVEFEEEEDEGACYAFELGPESTVFIVGQEFYEDDDFPNSDFSLIDVLGTHGNAIDTLVEKAGSKLIPERLIPAAAKHMMEMPEHLTVINASVDVIEHALTHAR
jgi:hypothetical protein